MTSKHDGFAFLKEVYNEVGDDTNKVVNIVDIANKIEGINNIQTIVENLEQKKYLKVAWVFGITETSIRITASGIEEAEAYLIAINSVSEKPKSQ